MEETVVVVMREAMAGVRRVEDKPWLFTTRDGMICTVLMIRYHRSSTQQPPITSTGTGSGRKVASRTAAASTKTTIQCSFSSRAQCEHNVAFHTALYPAFVLYSGVVIRLARAFGFADARRLCWRGIKSPPKCLATGRRC